MAEAKTIRPMTPKKFIKAKLSGKSTAEGFIAAHQDFIKGYQFLSPIVEAYDRKEILPTPTLQLMQSALLEHTIANEVRLALSRAKLKKPRNVLETSKPYVISIFVKNDDNEIVLGTYDKVLGYKIIKEEGGKIETVETEEETAGFQIVETLIEEEEMVYSADLYQEAEGLADRRLVKFEHSIYAEIVNNQGAMIKTIVHRRDAIARVYAKKKGPSCRNTSKSTSKLGFGIKASQDTASFSRG
jgi:hypothetical protein